VDIRCIAEYRERRSISIAVKPERSPRIDEDD
jgi:hypothetical protein